MCHKFGSHIPLKFTLLLKLLYKFFQHPSGIFMSMAKTTWVQIDSPRLKKKCLILGWFLLFVTSSSITQCQMQVLALIGLCDGCVFKYICVCFACFVDMFKFKWKPGTCPSNVLGFHKLSSTPPRTFWVFWQNSHYFCLCIFPSNLPGNLWRE